MKNLALAHVLELADNALIIGHRLSEWCGHGPVLEQDIAITNTSLDHLGQARSFYQHAADIFNAADSNDRLAYFKSPMLSQKYGDIDEDDLAYLRDAWDFRNVLLVEQPNGDWAHTIARSFFYDAWQFELYTAYQSCTDAEIAAIAQKSLKEVTYHLRWSSEWMIRLGDGTDESKARISEAVNTFWSYAGELLKPSEAALVFAENQNISFEELATNWHSRVKAILEEATLGIPTETWMHSGGKTGRHSENLGFILAEMQFMQRAYPGMAW